MEIFEVILVGFVAGTVSGLFGVGGGVVFVPSLVFLFGMTQAEANATSLLAIVPVAIVGSYRQNKYGNVAVREGVWIGVVSLPATVLAAFVANELPQRALQLLFVCFALYVAFRMGRRAIKPEPAAELKAS
ncbi:MAG: sulfite exporter TauE/SafE family protein [Thermoleophilaceae bacterium]|nr:sulfite exporter TauE/SafE family protein [Thermoleophilaceae bacterium]